MVRPLCPKTVIAAPVAQRLAEAHAPRTRESANPETTAESATSTGATSADFATAAPGKGAFGGGALGMPDYGQQLVELIQTVIRPETWDVNGGPGTIYYWRPGRALVVRQMAEVHGEVGGVLGQLRRAGQ